MHRNTMYRQTSKHSAIVVFRLELETKHSESISVVSEDGLEFHHWESQVSLFSTPKAMNNYTLIMIQIGP